jgi:hypothetical protein
MMSQPADNPIEPPEPAKLAEPPVAVSPESALQATVEALRTELASLRAQIAQRDERDAAVWLPLQRAAGNIMSYKKALAWATVAIKEGRSNEARKIGGRVFANQTALRAHQNMMKPPPG